MVDWQTFVVRIWHEASSGTWRGQIVHLPDQSARYFASLEQAADFLAQYVPGIRPPPESGPSRPGSSQEEIT